MAGLEKLLGYEKIEINPLRPYIQQWPMSTNVMTDTNKGRGQGWTGLVDLPGSLHETVQQ